MDKVNDAEWREDVAKLSVKFRAECGDRGLDEVVTAAAEAVGQALFSPGCLVRVTITNPNHGKIFKFARQVLVLREALLRKRLVDKVVRSRASDPQEVITVELTNGSGIEFVCAVDRLTAMMMAAGADLILNGIADESIGLSQRPVEI